MTGPRLEPGCRQVYVVRWVRLDGSEVRSKFYQREHAARVWLTKLRAAGKTADLYRSTVDWSRFADVAPADRDADWLAGWLSR